jgi:hypothetical protein
MACDSRNFISRSAVVLVAPDGCDICHARSMTISTGEVVATDVKIRIGPGMTLKRSVKCEENWSEWAVADGQLTRLLW